MAFSTARHDFDNVRYGNKILREEMEYAATQASTFTNKFFTRENTKERSVASTSISSPKTLKRLSENEVPRLSAITQGFKNETAWGRFGNSFEVTWESMRVDREGVIKKEVNAATSQLARTWDNYAGAIFRQAANTARPIADGRPLISSLHAIRNGGTQTNTFPDIQKPLNYTSLLEATDYLNRLKTNSGEKINRRRSKNYAIIIPDEAYLKETAYQLIGKNGAKMKPNTDTNNVNFFQVTEGDNYDLYVVPSLNLSAAQEIGETTLAYTSSGATPYLNRWFLVDTDYLMSEKCLEWVILDQSQEQSRVTENRSLSLTFDVYSWFGFGVRAGLYQWVFGSNGTNLATDF